MEYGTDRGGKARKDYLEKQKLISCGLCPYHRKENATRRRPKPNKHKEFKRDSIRTMHVHDESQIIDVD